MDKPSPIPFLKAMIVYFTAIFCISVSAPGADGTDNPKDGIRRELQIQQKIELLLENGDTSAAEAESDSYLIQQREAGDTVSVARALALKGTALIAENQNAASRKAFEEALALLLKINKDQNRIDRDKASILVNLAVIDELEGNAESAERRLSDALAMQDRVLPTDHIDRAATLIGLAKVSQMKGDFQTEERFWRQALEMRQRLYRPGHYNIAVTLEGLAGALEAQGRQAEAEPLLRKALSYRLASNAKGNPHLASIHQHLGVNLRRQGKLKEAEDLLTKALRLREGSPALPADRARNMVDLALVYISERRFEPAKQNLEKAIEVYKASLTDTHPWMTEARMHLALVEAQLGNVETALTQSRLVSDAFISRPPSNTALANLQYGDFVGYAWSAYQRGGQHNAAYAAEAFETAQRGSVTSAAKSAASMSLRLSASDPELLAIIRAQQDQTHHLDRVEAALIGALSRNALPEEIDAGRKDVDAIKRQLSDLDKKLTHFPAFQKFTRPKPISVQDAQSKLGKDAILLFAYVSYADIYVWAITSDSVHWSKIDVDTQAAAAIVQNLRAGLVFGPADRGQAKDKRPLYDLGLAYSFYTTLFQGALDLIAGKRHIYYVPTSYLATLPLNVLLDAKPVISNPTRSEPLAYTKASWLVRNHEIIVLPEVARLRSFGRLAPSDDARHPLIGFADPIYDVAAVPTSEAQVALRGLERGARRSPPNPEPQSLTGLDALKKFERLTGTRDELNAVAGALHAPASDLFLEGAASEKTVKNLDRSGRLADYKIIYFAMHGIVAHAAFGKISVGNAEPSLVMTVPEQATPEDDGLLSTSEIAELKLNADWVVLSACDTAAGENESADALSGLARAFFYAGAKSLIVTQWGASDLDTRIIMSTTFSEVAQNPSSGRAAGLQKAMLARIDGATTEKTKWDAYPSYWGPFELVVGAD